MPTGVYPRTEEWKTKLSLRFKGRPATEEARTPEARAKMRLQIPWSKGLTKETDARVASIGLKLKGRPFSESRKAAVSARMKGKKPSPQCIEAARAKLTGRKQNSAHIATRKGMIQN